MSTATIELTTSQQRCCDALIEHGGNKAAAAEALHMHEHSFRRRISEAVERGFVEPPVTNQRAKPTRATVNLDALHIDPELQPRVALDPATVAEYAGIYREHGPDAIDPIRVYRHPTMAGYILTRGFTRVAAARQAELEQLPAQVYSHSTDTELLLDSLSGNKHGQRLTTADKRRALELYHRKISESDWLSTRDLAHEIGCSHEMVSAYRRELRHADGSTIAKVARPILKKLPGLTSADLETALKAVFDQRDDELPPTWYKLVEFDRSPICLQAGLWYVTGQAPASDQQAPASSDSSDQFTAASDGEMVDALGRILREHESLDTDNIQDALIDVLAEDCMVPTSTMLYRLGNGIDRDLIDYDIIFDTVDDVWTLATEADESAPPSNLAERLLRLVDAQDDEPLGATSAAEELGTDVATILSLASSHPDLRATEREIGDSREPAIERRPAAQPDPDASPKQPATVSASGRPPSDSNRNRWLIEQITPHAARCEQLGLHSAQLIALTIGLETDSEMPGHSFKLEQPESVFAAMVRCALDSLNAVIAAGTGHDERQLIRILPIIADDLGVDWPALELDADQRFGRAA